MSDLNIHNSIAGLESFKSIESVLDMIYVNKILMNPTDNFYQSDRTFLSHLKQLLETKSELNDDEKNNFLEIFLTNQLYATTVQIHSLADLVAQLIFELRLVTLQRGGVDLTIDNICYRDVKQALEAETTGIYTNLLSKLTCFETDEFKYFATLSNAFKHKYIPLTNQAGHGITGELFESGFQVDTFVARERGTERLVAAAFLPEIIAKFDSFKSQIDQVIVELNLIVST
ncbi:hypothetical protein [Acinetobacter proteolyticus]|uniref:Uncharacterized protein n=1 Tax=Acinetobacter proteolyticus TaxID=1776741 RepID=A0A2N0WEU0_9GAMM|nr:hypothetical protein [Acinetobacter proteolyticus]MBK5649338.1 hypothetical protein [Acinetobacter sp.]PKF33399.1 hypothetical protein CW311_11385 [Acinetobacter proteolyticus]